MYSSVSVIFLQAPMRDDYESIVIIMLALIFGLSISYGIARFCLSNRAERVSEAIDHTLMGMMGLCVVALIFCGIMMSLGG